MRIPAGKLLHAAAAPWVLGAAVLTLGYSSDFWLAHLRSNEFYELSDDLFLGIMVGLVGSWWVRKRNREIRQELRRIVNINHLIRNELQVIVCSASMTKNAGEIKHIEQSAEQISWILRELLGPDYVMGGGSEVLLRAQAGGGSEGKG